MIHHGPGDYATAVSEASAKFQQKIEEMVHDSVPRVHAVIEQVENDVPTDAIIAGKALQFEAHNNGINVLYPSLPPLSIHEHAFNQIADRAKVRHLGSVLRDIRGRGLWGQELVAENLNRLYSNLNGERFLLRQVRGQLRGFLSDQFRRLDSRPLLDAFVGAIQRYGAKPIDGFALQTRMNVRAILPKVFEPFPGEIMAFGAQLSDSDYGDGKLAVSGFVLRMWCTNLATTEDVLSQVHLGRKLSDTVEFSTRTMELDTRAMASAINDVARHVLGEGAINRYVNLVRKANEDKIEPASIHAWVKKNLTKAEGDTAIQKFNSPDIQELPAGQTKWRWSNALSWLANQDSTEERRKLDLQEFAGSILK